MLSNQPLLPSCREVVGQVCQEKRIHATTEDGNGVENISDYGIENLELRECLLRLPLGAHNEIMFIGNGA